MKNIFNKFVLTTFLCLSVYSTSVFAATISDTYVSSTVGYNGYNLYHYEYVVESVINNKEISNITLNLCDINSIKDIYANDSFKFEVNDRNGTIKFDNIKPKGNTFIFGYYSEYAPELNTASIKVQNSFYGQTVYTPSCVIPEPNSAMFFIVGSILLMNRRKR